MGRLSCPARNGGEADRGRKLPSAVAGLGPPPVRSPPWKAEGGVYSERRSLDTQHASLCGIRCRRRKLTTSERRGGSAKRAGVALTFNCVAARDSSSFDADVYWRFGIMNSHPMVVDRGGLVRLTRGAVTAVTMAADWTQTKT